MKKTKITITKEYVLDTLKALIDLQASNTSRMYNDKMQVVSEEYRQAYLDGQISVYSNHLRALLGI